MRAASRSEGDSRVRWLLALVLAVGFLLRLTYQLEVLRAPDFDVPQFESQYHDYWARALVTGDWAPPRGVTDPEIRERPYFRPPGYPYFLASIYALGGLGYLLPRLVQSLLGLASCWLVYAFGRRHDGPATGLVAAALTAGSWILIFYEGELMEPPLLIALLMLELTLVAQWRDRFTAGRAAAAGVVLGVAALVRPNALVLAPAFLLWIVWVRWRRDETWRKLWRPALVFAAAVAVAVLPAAVRNYAVAGDAVLITSNGGVNLFVGTHPQSDGFNPGVPELGEITGLTGWDSFDYPKIVAGVERLTGREMSDSEVSRFFSRRALAHVREHSLDVLALTGRKLLLFWGPAEISNNKVLYYERRASPTLRLGLGFATLFALALAGLILAGREQRVGKEDGARREVGALLLLFLVAYCASFLPFFVAARFRVPVIPVLALLAGAGVARLWDALRRRRWRLLAGGVALAAALRVLAGVAWIPYQDDEALWHWRRGLLYQERGDLVRATAELERATTLDPGHGEAHLALAGVHAGAGRLDAAVAEYRAAVLLLPDSLAAHNNLALLLAQRGDAAGAVAEWEAALALDPERVSVLNNLAYALATSGPPAGDPARAVELAERAATLTGFAEPRVLATLAVAYRATGRADEAAALRQRSPGR